MAKVVRFGISMDSELLERFDQLCHRKGYPNRSEAVRDLVRDKLVEEEWKAVDQEVVAIVSLVYNHEVLELPKRLTELQHNHYGCIISTLHVHLDKHNCLEILVLRGKGKKIKMLAEKMVSAKGVKHGRFTMTTAGKSLV